MRWVGCQLPSGLRVEQWQWTRDYEAAQRLLRLIHVRSTARALVPALRVIVVISSSIRHLPPL